MNFSDQIKNNLRRQKIKSSFLIKPIQNLKSENLFYIKKNDDKNFIKSRLNHMKSGYLDMLGIESFKSLNFIGKDEFYFGYLIILENKFFVLNLIDESNEILIELNISEIKRELFLFTGMVIVIKGSNLNGNLIIASDIFDIQVVPINDSEMVKIEKQIKMKICFISGPFNNKESEEEQNLFNLLDDIKIDSDFLIILGPIINKQIVCEKKYDPERIISLFEEKLSKWIKKSPNRKIIIIPSIDDIQTLGIYPFGPFLEFKTTSIISFSNPTQFYIENVLFSISTNDLLLEMNKNGIYHSNESNNSNKVMESSQLINTQNKWPFNSTKIQKLSSNLIYQRTFLPTLSKLSYPINLYDPKIFNIKTCADIFVTCSKLKTFIYKDSGPFIVANVGSQPNLEHKSVLVLDIDLGEEEFDRKFDLRFEKFF